MTSVVPPICASCERFRPNPGMTCDAFPAGIPQLILDNEVDHRLPVEGDQDLQYKGPRLPDFLTEMLDNAGHEAND